MGHPRSAQSAAACFSAFPVQALWTIPRSLSRISYASQRCELNYRHKALQPHALPLFLSLGSSAKSAASVFLSCTKNTELTARAFARTFTFALNAKVSWPGRSHRPESGHRPAGLCRPAIDNDHQTMANLLPPRLATMKSTETKAADLKATDRRATETNASQWNTYRTRFLVKA